MTDMTSTTSLSTATLTVAFDRDLAGYQTALGAEVDRVAAQRGIGDTDTSYDAHRTTVSICPAPEHVGDDESEIREHLREFVCELAMRVETAVGDLIAEASKDPRVDGAEDVFGDVKAFADWCLDGSDGESLDRLSDEMGVSRDTLEYAFRDTVNDVLDLDAVNVAILGPHTDSDVEAAVQECENGADEAQAEGLAHYSVSDAMDIVDFYLKCDENSKFFKRCLWDNAFVKAVRAGVGARIVEIRAAKVAELYAE